MSGDFQIAIQKLRDARYAVKHAQMQVVHANRAQTDAERECLRELHKVPHVWVIYTRRMDGKWLPRKFMAVCSTHFAAMKRENEIRDQITWFIKGRAYCDGVAIEVFMEVVPGDKTGLSGEEALRMDEPHDLTGLQYELTRLTFKLDVMV